MSTKIILNEWRNFLKEETESDADALSVDSSLDVVDPSLEPLDRTHVEELEEIQAFLASDLSCDASSEEYASFVSCLEKRESADIVSQLVKVVRDCVSGF